MSIRPLFSHFFFLPEWKVFPITDDHLVAVTWGYINFFFYKCDKWSNHSFVPIDLSSPSLSLPRFLLPLDFRGSFLFFLFYAFKKFIFLLFVSCLTKEIFECQGKRRRSFSRFFFFFFFFFFFLLFIENEARVSNRFFFAPLALPI